jgi:hypothetical protein
MLSLAGLLLAQFPLRADVPDSALAKSELLENNVIYLRVGDVGTNLADEISMAHSTLSATNKIVGIILDLRFANGDDSTAVAATAKLFSGKKSPLAILVNGETHGAATALAVALREERAGLVFGGATAEPKPDIVVTMTPDDEKKFFDNPYAPPATNGAVSFSGTNDPLSFVDHMSEAQLVRERRKDGAEDDSAPTPRDAPSQPVIRDPSLARAVDLIEGLAVVRGRHP